MKTQTNSIQEIRDYARSEKLNYIEITGSLNGYPEPLTGFGITGFNSFEQCQAFASKFSAEIYEFKQKNGWHFWNADNCRYKASQYTLEELASDYEDYDIVYSLEDLEDTDRFNPELISEVTRVQIGNYLGIDTAVILTLFNGEYHVKDTITAGMSYNYDSSRYEIGVYFPYADFSE